jgi:hypothetical protein
MKKPLPIEGAFFYGLPVMEEPVCGGRNAAAGSKLRYSGTGRFEDRLFSGKTVLTYGMIRKNPIRGQTTASGMNGRKVISASRRIEMPGYFPDRLVRLLDSRCPPDRVHTVVLWSKRPEPILVHRDLARCLGRYSHVFLHLTVTGMGGSFLEPGIPRAGDTLSMIPALAGRLGSARRLTIRFDPIVHLRLSNGERYSNVRHFKGVAEAAARSGIERLTVSWMQSYPKVQSRLERLGIRAEEPSDAEREEEAGRLSAVAGALGLKLNSCCVPRLPVSACIDGRLLSDLHPDRVQASLTKAGGQRPACGCTESWDIGWYHPCPGGCLYCYARPAAGLRSAATPPE